MLIRAATTVFAAGIATALFAASAATASPERSRSVAAAGASDPRPQLTARTLLRKPNSKDIVLPVGTDGTRLWTGRLAVKFRDDLRMRADSVPSSAIRGARADAVVQVAEVLKKHSATVRPMFRMEPGKLVTLEERAARHSGLAQPDLQSCTFIDLPPERLLEAAREFNDMDIVEWAFIEQRPVPCEGEPANLLGENQSPQFGCGTNGAGTNIGIVNCNQPAPAYLIADPLSVPITYAQFLPARCTLSGACNNINACEATPVGVQCVYGCNQKTCCDAVSGLLPYCTDEAQGAGWDAACAAYANTLCGGPQNTVYSGGGGLGSPGIPTFYSYDPCFAMRGPILPPGYYPPYNQANPLTANNDAMVYGVPQNIGPIPVLAQPEYPDEYPAGCVEPNSAVSPDNCFNGLASSCDACPPCCCGTANEDDPTPDGQFGGNRKPCCSLPAEFGLPSCAYSDTTLAVPSQLLTYVTSGNGSYLPTNVQSGTTQFPGNATAGLVRVAYPSGSPSDEGDATTGVPQQAKPDPSLEGIGYSISGNCLTATPGTVGCNQTPCCVLVCRQDPSCCESEWDENCVSLAVLGAADPDGAGPLTPACSGGQLDTDVFPKDGTTPILTGGTISTATATGTLVARGVQLYTTGRPVLASSAPIPTGTPIPLSTLPTLNSASEASRTNPKSNLGTLSFLGTGYRGGGLDFQAWEALMLQLGLNPQTQGYGQGVTVAVLDYSAFVNHEDLKNRVTAEPNQTILLIDSAPVRPQHGTAVLGVVGAEKNSIGVTGVAWGARMRFYPVASREEGFRLTNALANAITDLDQGDVILMPLALGQQVGSETAGFTILADPSVFLLATLAGQSGIAVVVSAGNDSAPVVTSPDDTADSGAFVVGACWPGQQLGFNPQDGSPAQLAFPGNNYCRMPQSNFSDPEAATNAVHCSGWGTGVATTGWVEPGLYRGDNTSTDPLQVNQLRTYSAQFGGTSAAAAMIAGWVACVQGFAKAYGEAPLGTFVPAPGLPPQLRDQITRPSNINKQCGEDYSTGFPGFPQNGSAAVGDILRTQQVIARIGGFPNCGPTLSSVIANTPGGTGGGAQSGRIYTVVTGTQESGSGNSLYTTDGRFMRIAAVRRRAGTAGQGAMTPLLYPITGGTTDLQIERRISSPPQDLTIVGLQCRSRTSAPAPVYELVYFYNFLLGRWQSAGSLFLSATTLSTLVATPAGDLTQFALSNSSGGSTLYGRVYTVGFTQGVYSVLHDRVDLDVSENILILD
jgi:hypothetical protein